VIAGSTGCATPPCSLLTTFPHGIQDGNPQNIWTAEAQLPTPWVTWVTKFYKGDDMRFPFAGQLNDVFTDLNGTTSVGSAVSFTGKSIPFGCLGGTAAPLNCNGNPITVGSLRPIRGQGGFSELSFRRHSPPRRERLGPHRSRHCVAHLQSELLDVNYPRSELHRHASCKPRRKALPRPSGNSGALVAQRVRNDLHILSKPNVSGSPRRAPREWGSAGGQSASEGKHLNVGR
jgi:hypothetical protein